MPDDQQAVIGFLSRPSSYGPTMERVEVVETHISLVFLTGERAYKLKRAVTFPYLDFATAEQRRRAGAAELALRLLQPRPCRLIAIGGVSGTGKSTLAAALAPPLGARVLRSDVIRKRLFGVPPETRLAPAAYGEAMSRQVYERLRGMAGAALAAGYPVIIDAVALRQEERQSFAAVAAAAAVPFSGLWLEAAAETLAGRLAARRGDASDASPAVLEQQLRHDPGPIAWTRIDAGAGFEASLSAARRALALD